MIKRKTQLSLKSSVNTLVNEIQGLEDEIASHKGQIKFIEGNIEKLKSRITIVKSMRVTIEKFIDSEAPKLTTSKTKPPVAPPVTIDPPKGDFI